MSTTQRALRRAKDAPLETALEDIRHLPTIPIYSQTEPNLAGLMRLSRWHAYSSVQRGELPSLRVGGRILIPVAQVRRLLGDLPAESPPGAV